MDTEQLRARARAVFLACEEPVAKDISKMLNDAASEIDRLKAQAEPGAEVPCSVGLSAFTDADKREIDNLDARLKRHGFSWQHTDYITLQDIIPKLKALIDSGR